MTEWEFPRLRRHLAGWESFMPYSCAVIRTRNRHN